VRAALHTRHLNVPVALGDLFDRDNGVGAFRHDTAGRDRHRIACGKRTVRGSSGGNATRDA
jgi:hypothetical protein